MLVLKKINKSFGNQVVLKNISITFPDKGMFFLMGKSGAGKTTLLNILATFIDDFSGEYYFNNIGVHELEKNSLEEFQENNISYGFQDDYLMEDETVLENLNLVFYALGYQNAKENELIIEEYLNKFGLIDKKYAKTKLLSGGEKARVSIIRALLKPANIYLIDEPTSDLDIISSKLVYKSLEEKAKTALVIVVSHNLFDAKMYGDYVLTLENGIVKENKQNNKITNYDLYIDDESESSNCGDLSTLVNHLEYDKSFVLKKVEDSSGPVEVESLKKKTIKFKSISEQTSRVCRKHFSQILTYGLISSIMLAFVFIILSVFTFPVSQYYYQNLKNNEDNLDRYELYYESELSREHDNFHIVSIKKGILFEKKLKSSKCFDELNDDLVRYISVGNYKMLINESLDYDGVVADSSIKQALIDFGLIEGNSIKLFDNYVDIKFEDDVINKIEISKSSIETMKESDILRLESMPISVYTSYNLTFNDYIDEMAFSSIDPHIMIGEKIANTNEAIISLKYAKRILSNKYNREFSDEDVMLHEKELLKDAMIFDTSTPTYSHYYDNYINLSKIMGRKIKFVGISEDSHADIYLDSKIFDDVKSNFYEYYYYDGVFFKSTANLKKLSKFLSTNYFVVEGFTSSYQVMGIKSTLENFKLLIIAIGSIFLLLGIVQIIMLHKTLFNYLEKRNVLLKTFGMNYKKRRTERLFVNIVLSFICLSFTMIVSSVLFFILKLSKIIAQELFIFNIYPYLLLTVLIAVIEVMWWIIESKKISRVNLKD